MTTPGSTSTRWEIQHYPEHVPMGMPLPDASQRDADDERPDEEYTL